MQRRRLIRVLACALGFACLAGRTPALTPWRWRGSALGAEAQIDLWLDDPAMARRLVELARAEIDRLERVFSLHRADSALTMLNRAGHLAHPPLELVTVLEAARRIADLTDGAFDVTVQPLWRAYADHFAAPGRDPDGPPMAMLARLRPLVDHRGLEVRPTQLRFARAGMAATLNGIAQGFVADRVAALLQDAGMASALVDVGEIATLGAAPGGGTWQIRAGRSGPVLALARGALATSSSTAFAFDPKGRLGHLIDPATLRPAAAVAEVTVVADSAMIADALSTALAIRPDLAPPPGLGLRAVHLGPAAPSWAV